MAFINRRKLSSCSAANFCSGLLSCTFRRSGFGPVVVYSIVFTVVFVGFQISLQGPPVLENINEAPPALDGGGRLVEGIPSNVTISGSQSRSLNFSAEIQDAVTSTEESFVSTSDPVITHIANGNSTNIPKIPVVVWPDAELGALTAISKHLVENGLYESAYLEQSNDLWNFDTNVVWVGNYGVNPNDWCSAFLERILKAKEKRAKLGLALQWPVFIMDWRDNAGEQRCEDLETAMGSDFVKYSQRSIVKDRKWNDQESWVEVGQRLSDSDLAIHRHMPYFVRTDSIETLDAVLKEKHNMTLANPIETLERKIDVSHFWPRDMTGVLDFSCNLRKEVSRIIDDTGKNTSMAVFVGLAGKADREGRKGVHSDYIEQMLGSKIIVVTQRDKYEDHYRLFEAILSGAMVMTDRMLSLPNGLQNGTSIVEFDSANDLRSKILYYAGHPEERIRIASKGRKVSMQRHRAWHRIEEIIFGKPLSDCSNAPRGSPCPYIVHSIEATQG